MSVKKEPAERRVLFLKSYFVLAAAVTGKAITAVNRTITAGLEGDLRGGATFIADHIIHLAFAAVAMVVAATIRAAAGATAGLILEAFFSVEGLLRTGEEEFGAALAAGKGFVGIHASHVPPLIMSKPMCFKLVPWFHTSVT